MQQGVDLEVRDYFRNPFTMEELKEAIGPLRPQEVLSYRSPRSKELGSAGRPLTDEEILSAILKEPSLLRRPIIHLAGEVIVGFDRERLEQILSGLRKIS
ncbi:MAG: ArsC/Spx/MgsR family protein [Armatimonadota bacterium]|nr:ArsC/Spx/MgsR family protein [Armatimonadota bacterium]